MSAVVHVELFSVPSFRSRELLADSRRDCKHDLSPGVCRSCTRAGSALTASSLLTMRALESDAVVVAVVGIAFRFSEALGASERLNGAVSASPSSSMPACKPVGKPRPGTHAVSNGSCDMFKYIQRYMYSNESKSFFFSSVPFKCVFTTLCRAHTHTHTRVDQKKKKRETSKRL